MTIPEASPRPDEYLGNGAKTMTHSAAACAAQIAALLERNE